MSTISGGSGNLGYTPQEYTELGKELTANTLVAQMVLGISTKDETTFLLNAAGGREAVFHYKSHPERPLLDKPLFTSRSTVNYPGQGQSLGDLSAIVQSLLSALPEDLQARFSEEMRLPFDQRSLTFAAFSNFLALAAETLGTIQAAATPVVPGTQEDRIASHNQALPQAAVYGLKEGVTDLAAEFDTLTGSIDLSSLEFDQLSKVKQDLSSLLPEIEFAIQNPSNQDALNRISSALKLASDDFNHYSLSESHPMLGAALFGMSVVADLLPLSNTGLAPLQLNLAISLHGSQGEKSGLPLIGDGFGQISSKATDALLEAFLPNAGSAEKKLMANTFETVLAGAYTLGRLNGQGLGVLPQAEGTDAGDIAKARAFEFALMTTFFVGTGGVGELFRQLALQFGAAPEEQQAIGSALQSLTALFLIESSPVDNAAARHMALDAVQNSIASSLDALQRAKKQEAIEGELASETAVKVDIALNQALIAIKGGDYDMFYAAMNELLESAGTDTDGIKNGLKPLDNFSSSLSSGISGASEDLNSAMTGIIQQA